MALRGSSRWELRRLDTGTQPFGPRGERYQTKNWCREVNLKQSANGREGPCRLLHTGCTARRSVFFTDSRRAPGERRRRQSRIWKSRKGGRGLYGNPSGGTTASASSGTASCGVSCSRDIANLEKSVSWRNRLATQARGSDPVHARSQLQTTWSATGCADAGTNSYPGSPGCGLPSVEVVSNAEDASKAGTEYTNCGANDVFRVVPKVLSSS